MKTIKGDILEIEKGLIVNFVSYNGFNTALAKRIKIKYPAVYEKYKRYKKRFGLPSGTVLYSYVAANKLIVTIVLDINDKEALRESLYRLEQMREESQVYLLSEIDEEILEEELPTAILVVDSQ